MDKRGTPYVWGGASKRGYDCSGLMLRAYRAAGIDLPRTAAEQYHAFDRKISWKHLKPGDLVFFHGLGHVGMISRPGYMVDAPHTGDVVKEEKLTSWRRETFDGAVRPDPEGVRQWKKLHDVDDEKQDTSDDDTKNDSQDDSHDAGDEQAVWRTFSDRF